MGKPQQLVRKFELVSRNTLELYKWSCYGAYIFSAQVSSIGFTSCVMGYV